jgi:hypothetical protein
MNTASTPVVPGWLEKSIEKVIQGLQNDVVKKKIQLLILDPFLSYLIERLFPYLLVLVVVFAIFILISIVCMGIIIYNASLNIKGGGGGVSI